MGIPVAYAHLGYLSENGISTGYSLATAYRNYVRAVEEGYTKARDSIIRIDEKAILLEPGIGRRSATAFNDRWFQDIRDRAERGEPEYQYLLGLSFEEGMLSPQSYDDAVSWYLRSIESGYPRAMTRLGRLYYSGIGVERSYGHALYYLDMAYSKGDPDAAYYLGLIYERGLGVVVSPMKAASYYRYAHGSRNADAEFHLGNMYRDGVGVAQNDDLARFYYREAERHGHPFASSQSLANEKQPPFKYSELEVAILECIRENPGIRTIEIAEKIGRSESTTRGHLRKLKRDGIILRPDIQNRQPWVILKELNQ